VLFGILDDLKRLSEERSSLLVLVYLPTLSDGEPKSVRFWAAALQAKSRELQIPLIDLFEDFDKLPDHEKAKLYLPDRGHFNVEGNQRVASLLYAKLMRIPEVSRRVGAAASGPTADGPVKGEARGRAEEASARRDGWRSRTP
jgi:hypothetical protein